MAKNPNQVMDLLNTSFSVVMQRAQEEYQQAQVFAQEKGLEFNDCDLMFVQHQMEKSQFGKTLSELVQDYFQFETIERLALETASKLFNVTFIKDDQAPSYHQDVTTYIVKNKEGQSLGALMTDYQKRDEKTQGAWMNNIQTQSHLFGVKPVVINVGSFHAGDKSKSLSFEDATTVFHELGHALHGLLSNVAYPSQAGTSVATDFVELPSQFLENFISSPEGLKQAQIPEDLIKKITHQKEFGQGLQKAKYLLSAFLDMAVHTQPSSHSDITVSPNVQVWQEKKIEEIDGVPSWLSPRHHLNRFLHIFGHGYQSQYYSYLWAEVMEADLFSMFEQDLFNEDNKQKLHNLYSLGSSVDEAQLYRTVRGQDFSSESFMVRMQGQTSSSQPQKVKLKS